jgi:hypothetical protein
MSLRAQSFHHRVQVLLTGLHSTRHGRLDGLRQTLKFILNIVANQ